MQGRFGEGRALALDHLVTWMTPLCPWPRIADDLQGNILRDHARAVPIAADSSPGLPKSQSTRLLLLARARARHTSLPPTPTTHLVAGHGTSKLFAGRGKEARA